MSRPNAPHHSAARMMYTSYLKMAHRWCYKTGASEITPRACLSLEGFARGAHSKTAARFVGSTPHASSGPRFLIAHGRAHKTALPHLARLGVTSDFLAARRRRSSSD